MATYRYQFADALSGNLLEELPLASKGYSEQINGVGSCTGTLSIAEAGLSALWQQATEPRRTLLMVTRDGTTDPVWGGLIMKRRPTGAGHTTAEITAETLAGYWGRRRIKTDLSYTGTDLFSIVRAIITHLQAVTGGNMRMLVSSNMHGDTATIDYLGKDRVKGLDAINRMAEVSSFEYQIRWSRSGQVFTPTLTLAAPGLNLDLAEVLLEFPGNLVAPVETPQDGGDAPNALTGVGADSGGTPLQYEALDADEVASGYPIFEDEVQLKDEGDLIRLTARTQAALAARTADHVVPTVALRRPEGPGDLTVLDLPLGIRTRLRCTCPYHPATTGGAPGLDVTTRRISGITVDPTTDTVALELASSTGFILPAKNRRDPIAYLRDLDRRLRTLETTV